MLNERAIKFIRPKVGDECTYPISPDGFRWAIENIPEDHLSGFWQSYIRERIPYAFYEEPLLWEAVRGWVATRLNVFSGSVGLSGSAQTGFSMAPDKLGKPFQFDKNSDLDLFIVDEVLFNDLALEVRKFSILPAKSDLDKENQTVLSRTLSRGFLDTSKMPSNHTMYPKNANLNNLSSIVVAKLSQEGLHLKRSHFRVYENWKGLSKQMRLNFLSMKSKLKV